MYFCVNEFEVGVNDSIFSGNQRQKVYLIVQIHYLEYSTEQLGGRGAIVPHFLFPFSKWL